MWERKTGLSLMGRAAFWVLVSAWVLLKLESGIQIFFHP